LVTSTDFVAGAVQADLTVPLIVPPAALARLAPTLMLSATPAHAASTTRYFFITISSGSYLDSSFG
jgi:hypothetical protein